MNALLHICVELTATYLIGQGRREQEIRSCTAAITSPRCKLAKTSATHAMRRLSSCLTLWEPNDLLAISPSLHLSKANISTTVLNPWHYHAKKVPLKTGWDSISYRQYTLLHFTVSNLISLSCKPCKTVDTS